MSQAVWMFGSNAFEVGVQLMVSLPTFDESWDFIGITPPEKERLLSNMNFSGYFQISAVLFSGGVEAPPLPPPPFEPPEELETGQSNGVNKAT